MEPLRPLGQPNARFAGDDGAPDPLTRHAMDGARDHTGYIRALAALCTSRLLVPVVATGNEGEAVGAGQERSSELAAVTLTDPDDGHTYLLAFTGLDSLQEWRPDARPVPCTLDEVCGSVEPAGATRVLIDVAGPVQFVIAGEALQHLADGFAVAELEEQEFAWVKYAPEGEVPDAEVGPGEDLA